MVEKYNVLLITLDAFRRDLMSIYGNTLEITPNLDQLAKTAIVGYDAYCNGFATDPNHTTIFTGLLPWHHGILHHGPHITKYEKRKVQRYLDYFLPVILKRYGYKTYAIDFLSRWHKTGFDYYSGHISNPVYSKFSMFAWRYLPYMFLKAFDIPYLGYPKAEDIIKISKKIFLKTSKPFFMFLHFWDTHTPYTPPKKYIKEFEGIETEHNIKVKDLIARIPSRNFKEYMKLVTKGATYTDEIVHRYYASAKYIDEQIGYLLEILDKERILENTIVVITSDHGEHLGEHGTYFVHHTHYQVHLKIPLIIYHPNLTHKRIKTKTQHADIVPTLLNLLGIDLEKPVDGKNILQINKQDRPIFFGQMDNGTKLGDRIGVILNDFKYSFRLKKGSSRICSRCGIIHHSEKELFYIKKDPNESRNILDDFPDVVESLDKIIKTEIIKKYLEKPNLILKEKLKELKLKGKI